MSGSNALTCLRDARKKLARAVFCEGGVYLTPREVSALFDWIRAVEEES